LNGAVYDRAERGAGEEADGGDEADARLKEDALLPDPTTFLEAFPRCKRLVDTFRANPNTHNKTPLAILHEYATRLSLEVSIGSTLCLGVLLVGREGNLYAK